jgi:hypothetical protein
VDKYEPFLNDLRQRAVEAEIGELVETHCLDMAEIPQRFKNIDLLWSEGAAYNIGFANALSTWAAAIPAGGLAVVSELSWLRAMAPEQVKQFFQTGYPDMQSVPQNAAIAEKAGYKMLATHTLPTAAWVDGYYDVLGSRAKALVGHADVSVRSLAAEMLGEIDVFSQSDNSYGYVFYVLERT